MGKGKGLFGWLLGLLAGALLGVFFAPREGKEMRERVKRDRARGGTGTKPLFEDLKKMGGDIADTAKEIYETKEVQEVIERGRKKMHDMAGDMLDDVEDFQHYTLNPFVSDTKKKIEKTKEHAKRVKRKAEGLAGKARRVGDVVKKATDELKESLGENE